MLTRQGQSTKLFTYARLDLQSIAEKLIPTYALSGVTVCYGAGECNDVIRNEAGSRSNYTEPISIGNSRFSDNKRSRRYWLPESRGLHGS